MMAVEPGVDILVIAGLGIGAQLSAAAIGMPCSGAPRSNGAAITRQSVAAAVERLAKPSIPWRCWRRWAGRYRGDAGAILAARLAGIPIILDGTAAFAACAIGAAMRDDARDHCRGAAPDVSGDTVSAAICPSCRCWNL